MRSWNWSPLVSSPLVSILFVSSCLAGCSLNRTPIFPDVGLDGGDAGMDAGRDAPTVDGGADDANDDTPSDGGIDADLDAAMDDGGTDAPTDTGIDAPTDTGVDAPTDTGVDAPCIDRCSDPMTLTTCAGSTETAMPCELGCYAAPTPHCAVMVPANVGNTWTTATPLGAVTVTTLERIDTTTCLWDRATDLVGSMRSADTGGPVCLFVVDSLDIRAAGAVHASGNLPLIIISTGDITVVGAIGVDSARSSTLFGAVSGAGPRGPAAGSGTSAGGLSFDDGGGGGGGFGAAGGSGGTGGGAGAAGPARASTLMPLTGGSAGGSGAGPSTASGGSGGGTMQLTALGRFTLSGYVGASGAGGESGRRGGGEGGAGGGGGSGGGILLEAISFSLDAGVINIAGGGGGGGSCSTEDAAPGADGVDVPTMRAEGGARGCGGNAGNGGAGSGGASQTGDAGGSSNNGGGGGAGAGQVVLRTPGSTLDLSAAGTALNPTFASSAPRYVVQDISRR